MCQNNHIPVIFVNVELVGLTYIITTINDNMNKMS